MLIYFQISMFCFSQFLHRFWTQFLGFRFKGIEANYLYLSQANCIWKIGHMDFYTIHIDMKSPKTNNTRAKPKIKWYGGMIKLITQHSYFDKKPNKWMVGV
jgi:hypothetical protein